MIDERAILAACEQFRLNPLLPHSSGQAGLQLGQSSGASVEFHEFRPYVEGDDPRRVDWAAYARTRQLTVRLYREETTPNLDVVLDGSASMGIADGRKSALALELSGFFLRASQVQGGHARLHLAGDTLQPCALEQVQFTSQSSLLFTQPQQCAVQLRSSGLRVLISDFMTLQNPEMAIKRFAMQASQLIVVMVLGPWETAPDIDDLWTLQDVENQQTLSTYINTAQQQRYLQRLQQLKQQLRETCRQCGAVWIEVCADSELTAVLKRDFLPSCVVVAAR